MFRKIIIKISFLTLAIHFIVTGLAPGRARPEYVGVDGCRKCHESPSIGSQYKIWASTPHAAAYSSLRSVRAIEIGKKTGIREPSRDKRCIKCHATGGGKNMDIIGEGVGCEACHGPGSLYRDFDNHASFDSRENAYKKAIGLGMYPIIGDDHIKARERLCRHCHTEKRPCITREELLDKSKRELPLSIIADFIYNHPVR